MRLKSFRNKPGTILDAFAENGEHLGTVMTVKLPMVIDEKLPEKICGERAYPVVVIKQNIPRDRRSPHSPRGYVGLWSDCRVEHIN